MYYEACFKREAVRSIHGGLFLYLAADEMMSALVIKIFFLQVFYFYVN